MQKVITINLNGHAYQLDEDGYESLHRYLADAARTLETNPDRAEIIADLEQAIADKCRAFLGPHKSVVTAAEINRIVNEMGPVDDDAGNAGETGKTAAGAAGASRSEPAPKRLFRIPDGAMVAGVCTGLAAYFALDVALFRVGFVIAALLTQGAAILVYVGMMFLLPEARTPEERAAAGGLPFTAKEVIDRAKRQYAQGTRQLRRQWRQQQREWRRSGWRPGAYGYAPPPPPWVAVALPVLGLVHLALFLTMAAMMISLVNTGTILQWRLPDDIPVWAGALILLLSYQVVVSPLRAAHQWSWTPHYAGQAGLYAFWNAVVWLIGLAFAFWFASDHIPEIREFLQRLPDLFRDFVESIRGFANREPR
jgi:phage shock protein PspC (stress-responsive transcriptional regulator)